MPDVVVTVEHDLDIAQRLLREFGRDQVPFASARALTRVGSGAAADSQRRFGRYFEQRSRGFERTVVRDSKPSRSSPTFARKSDWPRTRSTVYIPEDRAYMALHALGGIKRPQRGASRIAIPTRLVARTAKGKVAVRHKPRRLRSRKSAAVVEDSIRVRQGKRGKSKLRAGSWWVFYLLRRRVRIRKRWHLARDVRRYAREKYPQAFAESFDQALRSSRRRG